LPTERPKSRTGCGRSAWSAACSTVGSPARPARSRHASSLGWASAAGAARRGRRSSRVRQARPMRRPCRCGGSVPGIGAALSSRPPGHFADARDHQPGTSEAGPHRDVTDCDLKRGPTTASLTVAFS
jgi:hypothetical protein